MNYLNYMLMRGVNMRSDLVSVIVPTYKRKPEMLKRCVDSVLSQTYKNIELIVVDDSPSDYPFREEVKSFLNSYDNRIHYIQHHKNMGANIARNTGVDNSNGKYIAFLDDDDEWAPTKLEKQYKLIYNNPNVSLVYCRAQIINENSGETKPIINWMYRGSQYHRLLKQNFIGSNSFVLVDKEKFYMVGKYDESLLSNQDYDLFIRLSKDYEIDFIDEVLVNYYIHEGERISTNAEKQLQGRLALYDKYLPELKKDKDLYTIWNIKNIPLYYRVGEKKKATKSFLKLFTKRPIFLMNYLRGTLDYIKLSK